MLVELVTALRVVLVLEYRKEVDVEVVVDVLVLVLVWPPFAHPEGQYSAVNVFPREVSMLTFTLPDVRQLAQDVDRMPIAHPRDAPQPVSEPVPSPTAKDTGKVTFKSPASLLPLTRNSDPREDGFVEAERAFPVSVVTKTAVIVTGIPPELEAFTSKTHPTQVEPEARPAVTVRLSALAPWTPPSLARAPWADESEACPAYT
jgi:hypothetical protein